MPSETKSRLEQLTRADARGTPYAASVENIEIATAYAIRAARKYVRRLPIWMDREAFEESVIIAVMRAARNYDAKSKASFFTYAALLVGCEIKEESERQNRGMRQYEYFDADLKTDEDDDGITEKENALPDHSSQVIESEHLLGIIKSLPENLVSRRNLEIFLLHTIKEMKIAHIAAMYSLSAWGVWKIIKRTAERIRAYVASQDYAEASRS